MKKLFAILMSVVMIVAFMPTLAFADGVEAPAKNWESNGKFMVGLQSGATTATAEVYDDYSVLAKVSGNTVDAAALTVSAKMRNVESLGVTGERSYSKTFETGLNKGSQIPLPQRFKHIFGYDEVKPFSGANITGQVDGKDFGYTVSGFTKKSETPEYELTAKPTDTEKVRKAWHALTANVSTDVIGDNSKIEIPEGAYLQVGKEKLEFKSKCLVDPSSQNNGAGTVQAIKDAAELDTEAANAKENVELYVPKDSVIQLSSSLAKLNRGIYIRSDIQLPENTLANLRTAANTGLAETVVSLINVVDGTVALADRKRIKVDVLSAYSVTVDGKKTMYAYNDTFDLESAGAGYVWKCENEVVEPGTKTVTKDMILTKTQDSTPVTPGGSGGPAVVPPATDNVTNNAADKNTTADLTPAVKDNKAETTVDAKTADKIVEKALENKSEEIIVDAAGNNTVASSEVGIPEKTVKEIAEKTDANLVIKTDNGKVDLDKAAVKAVADQAGTTGTVKLIVETVKNDADICHVNLKLVTSNGAVTDFKGGNVKVTINLTKELAAKELVCVYIDDNGIYTLVEGVLNADGTYTFTTGHFSEYAVMAKAEADKKIAEQLNTLIKEVNLKVRTSKTAKKNIKAVVSGDVKAITDAGYTVKYKFYRSEKKASKYVAKATKAGKTYVNTAGKKGTKYYYKAKALVYDGDKLVGQTVLKQCKYGARTWSK